VVLFLKVEVVRIRAGQPFKQYNGKYKELIHKDTSRIRFPNAALIRSIYMSFNLQF